MILQKFVKQPWEEKDYDIDFAPWLTPISDTLDDVDPSVVCLDDPDDTALVIVSSQISETVLKLWISGGTADRVYKVTVKMTSSSGRKDESELIFAIKEL